MFDYEIDDDAKTVFESMRGKTERTRFEKYVKNHKKKYPYWLNWFLGIKYSNFVDINNDWV